MSFNSWLQNLESRCLLVPGNRRLGRARRWSSSSSHPVFELAQGSGTITTLDSFNVADGGRPLDGLIIDSSGNLYGTTYGGGVGIFGTVFEIRNPGTTIAIGGFPSPATAGAAGTFTVTAKNADGTTDTAYTGTVHFTSSDGQARLPADYTFTAADAGVHTFSATMKTAGTQSLAAADTVTGRIVGSAAGIVVKPAAASQLIIGGLPGVTHGVAFSLTLTVVDAYGNMATGYVGTVHFSSSDNGDTAGELYLHGSRRRAAYLHQQDDPEEERQANPHGHRHAEQRPDRQHQHQGDVRRRGQP